MGSAIDRPHIPGQVSDRPGQDINIMGQTGRHKCQRDMDPRIFKVVDGTRWQDLDAGLRKAGQRVRCAAHQSIGFAVDTEQTGQRHLALGPVARRSTVQRVGHGPDAEKRIGSEQRHGGGPEWVRGRLSERGNGQQRCGDRKRLKSHRNESLSGRILPIDTFA